MSSSLRIIELMPLGQRVEVYCHGRLNGCGCTRDELVEPAELLKALGSRATFADARRRIRCTTCGEKQIQVRASTIDHYAMCDADRRARNDYALGPDGFPTKMSVEIGAVVGRGWKIAFWCSSCSVDEQYDPGAVVRRLRALGLGDLNSTIESLGAHRSSPCRACGHTSWTSTVVR